MSLPLSPQQLTAWRSRVPDQIEHVVASVKATVCENGARTLVRATGADLEEKVVVERVEPW